MIRSRRPILQTAPLAAMLLAMLLAVGLSLLPARFVAAAEPAASPAVVVPGLPVEAARPLPEALRRRLPESLDDLRAIETRVKELVDDLRAVTVAVQVGPAQGSGVIVSDDGYILTAAHVSGPPGRRVTIVRADGTRLSGITLGRERELDAGLVQITDPAWQSAAGPKTVAKVGETASLLPGDWVIATGHPGGFDGSRTPVVRLGRVILKMRSVIQTDCTLVGGDSGGPLFDLNGRVVGIHSRIGPAAAFNFHVPISAYTDGWEWMTAGDDRPSDPRPGGPVLGVNGEDAGTGCRITMVTPNSAADLAGLRVGDIILALGNEDVDGIESLIRAVNRHEAGDELRLRYRRDGRNYSGRVELGRRPER